MGKTVVEALANMVQARLNCIASNNKIWHEKWDERIAHIEKEYLPSGSGVDNGTKIDLDKSNGDKLVFDTAFHHMDEHGFYDGWTEHTIIVTPAFIGKMNLKVTGKNRNDIKEYLGEMFYSVLSDAYRELSET